MIGRYLIIRFEKILFYFFSTRTELLREIMFNITRYVINKWSIKTFYTSTFKGVLSTMNIRTGDRWEWSPYPLKVRQGTYRSQAH